jgi:4-hydroxy-4-methyl-2-oxoglutarate aldolase
MDGMDDAQLFALIRESLYTPVMGDILDSLGFHHQFLHPALQPMKEEMVVVGRAMPVLIVNVFGPQKLPFGRLTEALDQIGPGEVYICTGTLRCASWGEILTVTAKKRGGCGAIIDGFHRDTLGILSRNWPVFSRGRFGQDAAVRSAVVDFRCPIEIDEVRIEPGDLVFGDRDGVLVIPKSVEHEVLTRALEKARSEQVVLREIENGLSSTEAFRKYKVL